MKIVDPKNKIVERQLQKQETESKIARIKQKKVKGRTIQIQINYTTYYYGYWKDNQQHKMKLIKNWLLSLSDEDKIKYARINNKDLSTTGYKFFLLNKAGWRP